MRLLTDHQTNPANEELRIEVMDEPGAGGACHHYVVGKSDGSVLANILFQDGPIKETGVNGITQEALLAIVMDRLRGFQSGAYACTENADALTHTVAALECLKSRTLARQARGVEGTDQV